MKILSTKDNIVSEIYKQTWLRNYDDHIPTLLVNEWVSTESGEKIVGMHRVSE